MSLNVLITGGAGFIGSTLAHRFAQDGYRVTVLDSLIEQVHGADPETTSPLLRSTLEVATVVRGTVTSRSDLEAVLGDADLVVHLAAETGTGQSMYEIDRYSETNVGGTAKLLDILANTEHRVRRIVLSGSRSVYGEGSYVNAAGTLEYPGHRPDEQMAAGDFAVRSEISGEVLAPVPTAESALLHPSSVYGITKQVQEQLISVVAPTVGVEPVVVRYQNVYGPGQSLKNPYTGILSIFSTLIRQNKRINIFEDGEEARDFVYIDDVVEATYLAATTPAAAGGVFNVGSGVPTTVNDVVQGLAAAFGVPVDSFVSGNYRFGDIRYNVADVQRAREVLGFEARTGFSEGLERFVAWVLTEPVEGDLYEKSLAEMAERKMLK